MISFLTGTKKKKKEPSFTVYFANSDILVKSVKLLSEGAFAYVYLVKQVQSGPDKFFALKKITAQQSHQTT